MWLFCFYRAMLHACGAGCRLFAAADWSSVWLQGTCKSFDASANGYARADGIAIVVLRKAGLKQQIGTWAARQPYAQVLACATNNDGHTKEGITFPSGPAQKALAQEVHSCLPHLIMHRAALSLPVMAKCCVQQPAGVCFCLPQNCWWCVRVVSEWEAPAHIKKANSAGNMYLFCAGVRQGRS